MVQRIIIGQRVEIKKIETKQIIFFLFNSKKKSLEMITGEHGTKLLPPPLF